MPAPAPAARFLARLAHVVRRAGALAIVALVVSTSGSPARAALSKGITLDWTCSGTTCGGSGTTVGTPKILDFTTPAFIAGSNKFILVGVGFSDPTGSVSSVVLDPAGINLSLANIGSRDNNDGSGATCEVNIKGVKHTVTSGTKTIRVTTSAAMRVTVSFMSFSNVLDQAYTTGLGYFSTKGAFTTTTTMLHNATHATGGVELFGQACATRATPADTSTMLIGSATAYDRQIYVANSCFDTGFDCHTMEGIGAVRPAANTTTSEMKFDVSAATVGKWALGIVALDPFNTSAVGLDDFAVTRLRDRVRVGWRTGFEIDNLGYHVWRDDGGALVRITPVPVTGSALLAGAGVGLHAGRIYSLDDRIDPSQPAPARYFLEEIDMSGQGTTRGPARVEVAKAGAAVLDPTRADGTAPVTVQALEANGQGAPAPAAAPAPVLEVGQVDEGHWARAARPAVKLSVDHAGWYQVGQPAAVAAGLEAGVDPRRLALFVEGREVPLEVTGEQDGVLDPSDQIGFYGRGQNAPATNLRVYWLTVLDRPGLRVQPVAQAPTTPAAASWFWAPIELRPRSVYFTALLNGPESNFFGPLIRSTPTPQILRADHAVDAGAERALLEVGVQGVSETPHTLTVQIDGVALGTLEFDGRERRSRQWPLPGPLPAGAEIEVALQSAGGEADVSILDFIRLRYPRALVADQGVLSLTAAGGATLTVTGFDPGDPVNVYDISDEAAPTLLGQALQPAAGAISFVAPGVGLRTLLARAQGRAELPQAVIPNHPSRWSAAQPGADLLVIGRADLLPALHPWTQMREAQGWTVALVDIEDVYDEFSFGGKNPDAIRSFIARARQAWSKAPRAVVLLGDASFDPRNFLGKGDFDIVPSKLVDTTIFETASDDWFTDFDHDDVADVPVGRWPVRTPAEASALVSKLLAAPAFESPETVAARPVVLVADRNDEQDDFAAASASLRGGLAPGLGTIVVDRNREADPIAALKTALQASPALVNYVGHGSQDLWSAGFLSSDALPLVGAGAAPAFWSAVTCLNGFFQDASRPSLAEALLQQPSGGAFGVWASSGLTPLAGQTKMARAFLDNLTMRAMTVGEAARSAKAEATNPDVRKTWILFGDPTWQLFAKPSAARPVPELDAAAPSPAPAEGGVAGPDAAAPPGAESPAPPVSSSGCSCQVGSAGENPPPGLGVVVAALIALVRRRRR